MAHPTNSPAGPRRENRLGKESSPYLLQHRFNPVDWRPWGAEAFEEARRRDVPIFLSIGYSTCYWCHVMERESFESESIAEQMNEHFVCIKVDREERPDVDEIYMAAVQAFRGQGGWPISIFLEPGTLKPFWAGTYFPAEPKFSGIPTFPQVLQGLSNAWRQERDEIIRQSEKLADAVRERIAGGEGPVRIGVRQVTDAVAQLLKIHDPVHGGFGGAPKFPQPVYLDLLLETRRNAADETRSAIDASVRRTLDQMSLGGIFDQVGGGFHRYSVDAHWTVPHFEKMLYDNAQLIAMYAAASSVYDDPHYRRIACRTAEYVLREMTFRGNDGRSGAFFSAQDAEVNHREGLNYLWTSAQLSAVLEPDDLALAVRVYGLDAGPNFRDPHHPGDAPTNVLRWSDSPGKLAAAVNLGEDELLTRMERINERLYLARRGRDQPVTDDKIIASWNGLMIGALARAGTLLHRPDFTAAAEEAAEFVLAELRLADGSLARVRRPAIGNVPTVAAFLEDYACMIHACVELHRSGGDANGRWLSVASRLAAESETRFGDQMTGAYFDTTADRPDLFVRSRSTYDGALPSGSSIMINAMIDLFEITGDRRFLERALRALRALSGFIASAPLGAAGSTRALLRLLVLDVAAVRDAFAGDADPERRADEDFTPVEIHAAVERIVLAPDQPAGFVLRFRIAPGFHINAADPGDGPEAEDLVALRVHMLNGDGVRVFAEYPEGIPYGKDGAIRVLSGEFEIPVVLERSGEWTGRPLIGVTYQACTEDACLRPRTVELDVAIDRRD